MLEYSALVSKNLGGWFEEVSYLVNRLSSSPYFWPGLVGAVVMVFLAARWFSK